jgi:hypothetical protein
LCLTYLTLLYRKRQQVNETAAWAERTLEMAQRAHAPHYAAAAHAALAWVAWRRGDLAGAEAEAQTALAIWGEPDVLNHPLVWTAVWPLIGVSTARNAWDRAMDYVPLLLDPNQQQLPEAMTAALEKAISAWNDARADSAQRYLQQAAQIATDLGYL